MSNGKYDIDYLRKYHRGELTSREMFLLEKEAESDPMLMDMLLGMESESPKQHKEDLAKLKDLINKRTAPQREKRIINWKLISIAASLVVLMSISYFLLRDNLKETSIIAQAPVQNRIPEPSIVPIETDTIGEEIFLSDSNRIAQAPRRPIRKPGRAEELYTEKIEQQNAEIREMLYKRLDSSRNRAARLADKPKSSSSPLRGEEIASINSTQKSNQISIRGVSSLQNKNIIGGVILDGENGLPIPSAIIKNLDDNTITVSDSLGRFIVQTNKNQPKLEAKAIGFETQNLIASNDYNSIRLRPSNNQIDEVVVVAYGAKAKKAVTGSVSKIASPPSRNVVSEPAAGWPSYRNYINEATKLARVSKTEVYVLFDIDEHGRPKNIRINQSGGPIADQKAVDIIRNGPDWRRGSSGKGVELKLDFDR
ncbi:energy transducer TonB [Sphingobacterium hungaricum]|uniref:TonB C-terminal domain-containing protein n=1 Tax=Sphingobacterium hungaricum TaxID=2082723 RepID=A0A928V0G8_9SPHI|nr:carboxypeptidase-like regulatory domain-containing protein [Sphingobacterium hungaricum]MBE8715488.1 hypothetical protein [Sphingobacterium hungaricum]